MQKEQHFLGNHSSIKARLSKFLSPSKQSTTSPSVIEREGVRQYPESAHKKQIKRKRAQSVEISTHFQMSASHLGFLLQEQKNSQMEVMLKSDNKYMMQYYFSLKQIFEQVYEIGSQVQKRVSDSKDEIFNCIKNRELIQILMDIQKWNNDNWINFKILASNIYSLEPDKRVFEQKIQFVCRRIALNLNKSQKIKQSYFNQQLKTYWQNLQAQIKNKQQPQKNKKKSILEKYKAPPEKLALFEYQQFVREYLIKESFIESVRSRSTRHKIKEIDQEYLPRFSFQFVIIQIFCLDGKLDSDIQEDDQEYYRALCKLI